VLGGGGVKEAARTLNQVCLCMLMCVLVQVCVCMCVFACLRVGTCVYKLVCACVYVCLFVCVRVCVQCTFAFVFVKVSLNPRPCLEWLQAFCCEPLLPGHPSQSAAPPMYKHISLSSSFL